MHLDLFYYAYHSSWLDVDFSKDMRGLGYQAGLNVPWQFHTRPDTWRMFPGRMIRHLRNRGVPESFEGPIIVAPETHSSMYWHGARPRELEPDDIYGEHQRFKDAVKEAYPLIQFGVWNLPSPLIDLARVKASRAYNEYGARLTDRLGAQMDLVVTNYYRPMLPDGTLIDKTGSLAEIAAYFRPFQRPIHTFVNSWGFRRGNVRKLTVTEWGETLDIAINDLQSTALWYWPLPESWEQFATESADEIRQWHFESARIMAWRAADLRLSRELEELEIERAA